MRTLCHAVAVAALVSMLAGTTAIAGGPNLSLEGSCKPGEALLLRVEDCVGDPAQVAVQVAAEGRVGTKYVSLPVKLEAGDHPGEYRLRWNRPIEGRWLLRATLLHGRHRTYLIEVTPDGHVRVARDLWRSDGRREARSQLAMAR